MRLFLYLLLFPFAALAQPAPEPATNWQDKTSVRGDEYMVVTAHLLASEAAAEMLDKGGSAVDAAIAAQMLLTLVEPQSSGIGGGGFMLHYDARSASINSYDGREVAPMAVTPDVFLDASGQPMPFMQAVRSGKSVGVPGLVAMLEHAHKQHGKLPWKTLLQPAIIYAQTGFRVSPRLHKSISYALETGASDSFKRLYTTRKGTPPAIDTIFTNRALANSLKALANKGAKHFYTRAFATQMVDAVQAQGGALALDDFRSYKPIERPVACGAYREYTVCSMDAPSSGMTILQTLAILETFTLDTPNDVGQLHTILEAQKRAFADRNQYIADPAFVRVPYGLMLAPQYIQQRRKEMGERSSEKAKPGDFSKLFAADNSYDMPSTSHMSIVDKQGNAVSLTSSVEHSFGSGIVVGGFVLNNQLTDFAFRPTHEGKPVANAVAAGKRPRSSMSPTMVFDGYGDLYAVLGSPGGSSIIAYVTKTIIALIDWKFSLQAAINSPHFMHKNGNTALLEEETYFANPLRELGHAVEERPMSSGVHGILVNSDKQLIGAADPRREGVPLGK